METRLFQECLHSRVSLFYLSCLVVSGPLVGSRPICESWKSKASNFTKYAANVKSFINLSLWKANKMLQTRA